MAGVNCDWAPNKADMEMTLSNEGNEIIVLGLEVHVH